MRITARFPERQAHDFAGLRDRQRPKEHDIDEAKNRGVRADSERERQNRDGSEAGILAQHARAEAHILPQGFEPHAWARAANFFLHLFDSAHLDARGAPRFLLTHSLLHFFIRQHFGVRANLGVQFAFIRIAVRASAKKTSDAIQHAHNITSRANAEDAADRRGNARPTRGLRAELPPPRSRDLVKLRAAIVFRFAPRRRKPAFVLHAMQGRK
jgi:hypothetical protein